MDFLRVRQSRISGYFLLPHLLLNRADDQRVNGQWTVGTKENKFKLFTNMDSIPEDPRGIEDKE